MNLNTRQEATYWRKRLVEWAEEWSDEKLVRWIRRVAHLKLHADGELKVWIVGRYQGETWQVQGVYTSRQQAEAHTQPNWFVGPVQLDTPLPEDAVEWPGAFVVDGEATTQ